MICPVCPVCPVYQAQGLTSSVVDQGTTARQVGYQPYYDAAGTYHRHNPNMHATFFQCSAGHQFERIWYKPCPSCGAVMEQDKLVVIPPPAGIGTKKA